MEVTLEPGMLMGGDDEVEGFDGWAVSAEATGASKRLVRNGLSVSAMGR